MVERFVGGSLAGRLLSEGCSETIDFGLQFSILPGELIDFLLAYFHFMEMISILLRFERVFRADGRQFSYLILAEVAQ